jgi:regulator of cell morphogenesis and NO signaling
VFAIAADLDPHLMKEERILFPFIGALDRARASGSPAPRPMFGTVANPIRMMRHEHTTTSQILDAIVAEMGKHPAMRGKHPLFRGIDEFVADLVQHMHVENDILFPMAESLERG